MRGLTILLALLTTGVGPGPAQEPAAQSEAATPTAPVALVEDGGAFYDPAVLEAFIDGLVQGQLRERKIAGATVAVVGNGEELFTKGYGYADVDARRLVDPEETLFRIASVTKLFTFTAVMQLVEEGLLDLDADVNEYLDFRIPDTYPGPITLTHLMTHTAGFEEDLRNLFTFDPERLGRLDDWVKDNLPHRVRPPGTFSVYSNYGTALAGYIVERVSGLPWEDYIERRILGPLGSMRLAQVEPLLFREELGHTEVVIRTDDGGRPTHAFVSLVPMMAAERVPWLGAPPLHFAILGGGFPVFLGILLAAPVGWFRRWRRGVEEDRTEVVARRSLLVAAAAHVAAALLFAWSLHYWNLLGWRL